MHIILIIALLFGGVGVSVVADGSLPGDVLYSVKTGVNENVKLALTLGNESKGILRGELASERLREAEQLISESKLTAELAAEIKANFEKQALKITEISQKLVSKNKNKSVTEINSNFEAKLRAHERILSQLQVSDPEVQGEISAFLELARNNISVANSASVEAESKLIAPNSPDVEEAAKGKQKAAENKLQEVENFINKIKARSEVGITSEAEARLQVAKNTFEAGKIKINASQWGEAFQYFQKSIRIAEEAQALAEARNNLKIKVSSGADNQNPSTSSSVKINATSGLNIDSKAGVKLGN